MTRKMYYLSVQVSVYYISSGVSKNRDDLHVIDPKFYLGN